MLKVVISENGSNLCIETGINEEDVKLTVYADEDVVDAAGSVTVSRSDLNRAIAFVMGDDLQPEEPVYAPVPTIELPCDPQCDESQPQG
jgi:hypothetical protein